MSHRHVRALAAIAALALCAGVGLLGLAPPAQADRPTGGDVALVLTTGDISPFTSVLASCASGTVTNDHVHVQFTKPQGIFNGSKVFVCDGNGGGFTVHLSAKFDSDGSVGSWAVIDSWGSQAGLHGSGPLVGIDFDGGIADHYQGMFRP
jgi:hypothetical protein